MPIVTGSGDGPKRNGRRSFEGSEPQPDPGPSSPDPSVPGTPVDLDRIVGEVASGLGDTVTEPDFAGAANALALRLPRRLNTVFMEEARDGKGGSRNFFERVASRMLDERQSFMDGVTGSFGLSTDEADAVDRRSRQMTAALLRRAGRKAADMRKQAHSDDLAAMGKELQQDVLDGSVAVDLAASRFQMAAENARAFMDPDAAAKAGEEGERALTRASLDRLIALDPVLALTRIGNGTMDDLVRLKLLGAEDVTDLKSKAEGEAARKAAKAAAGSVDGVPGSAIDVGLSEIREAQKTIAGDLRSALEAGDDAAFDTAVGKAEALVRFHGSITSETPEQTEAKVDDLRARLDQLREQRDEGIVPVADETGEPDDTKERSKQPDRSNIREANEIGRLFIKETIDRSRTEFIDEARRQGLDPEVAAVFYDLINTEKKNFQSAKDTALNVFEEKGVGNRGEQLVETAERFAGSDRRSRRLALSRGYGLLVPEARERFKRADEIGLLLLGGVLGRRARRRQGRVRPSSTARESIKGRFDLDAGNQVVSTKGEPIRFFTQEKARSWIEKRGHATKSNQLLEIAEHPSGKGLTIRLQDTKAFGDGKIGSIPEGARRLRTTRVAVPESSRKQLGIGRQNVFADYNRFQAKHPEAFRTTRDARRHVEYVLSKPTRVFDTAEPNIRLVWRKNGTNRVVAIRTTPKGGVISLRSAYNITGNQLESMIRRQRGGR